MKVFFVFIALLGMYINNNVYAQQVPQFQEPVYYEDNVNHHPFAPSVQKKRTYIENMVWNNKVRCGTNMSVKSYAHKKDGVWVGIDADMCRVIAQAVIGNNTKIEMVNVAPSEMEKALDEGKIDVMLSGQPFSANIETARKALSVGLLYFDHQMLMVKADDSDNLEDYRGKKICISTDADYFKNLDDYNMRYNLGLSYLTYPTLAQAKEAFLLNRCQMMTASGMTLHGVLEDLPKANAKILNERVSMYPVYAFVQRDNAELRLALKWIFNALLLAEQYDINSQNLSFYATNDDPELRNLLGDDPKMWKDLKLRPKWLREVIANLGNYKNIFDKNIGRDSKYKLNRDEGQLVKDGGTVYPVPFI